MICSHLDYRHNVRVQVHRAHRDEEDPLGLLGEGQESVSAEEVSLAVSPLKRGQQPDLTGSHYPTERLVMLSQ